MQKQTTVFIASALSLLILVGAGCSTKPAGQAVSTDPYSTSPSDTPITQPAPGAPNSNTMPSTLQANTTYTAVLKTDKGDIEIALAADATPITVNNFVTLAKKDFYNGTIFHRTIKGFMIQGGDPTGTGAGGPGYKFADEPFDGEYTRGTVAMANAGPNTNGSQFFIMHGDVPLPKNYVIFGKVTKGLEVVDAIATAPVAVGNSGEESQPVTPVTVKTVTIEEKAK